MKIYLIRHGKTQGNLLNRYIGVTDEGLCEKGIHDLYQMKERYHFFPDYVYISPMLRCRQTADILFPEILKTEIWDFRECDFGEFENKNYKELSGNENYQKWIDSNASIPFPNGEDLIQFKERCCKAFQKLMFRHLNEKDKTVAIVVHGGTIMSIMEKYAVPHKSYYEFHLDNGEVYCLDSDTFFYEKVKEV